MHECDDRNALFECIAVLLFGKVQTIIRCGAIACTNNDDLKVELVNNFLIKSPLVVIRCRELIHTRRYAVKFQQCPHDLEPPCLEIHVCGARVQVTNRINASSYSRKVSRETKYLIREVPTAEQHHSSRRTSFLCGRPPYNLSLTQGPL